MIRGRRRRWGGEGGDGYETQDFFHLWQIYLLEIYSCMTSSHLILDLISNLDVFFNYFSRF